MVKEMKKKIYSILIIFILLFSIKVNAQEFSKDEIENGTYIIGSHEFTRAKNEEYDGTLTIEHIMLASTTIGDKALNNMKIYYKNARGNWVNPITNASIEDSSVPSKFNIRTVNLVDLKESYAISYIMNGGKSLSTWPTSAQEDEIIYIQTPADRIITVNFDANSQGATIKDSEGNSITSMKQTLEFSGWQASEELNSEALYGTTSDNVETSWRSSIISQGPYFQNLAVPKDEVTLTANWVSSEESVYLPNLIKEGYTCSFNTKADGSGRVYEKEAEYNSTNYSVNTETLFVVCELNQPEIIPAYGDANDDGVINGLDLIRIHRFIQGSLTPTSQQKVNADINADGIINDKDIYLLRMAYVDHSFHNLPTDPIIVPLHSVTYIISEEEVESKWIIENYKLSNYNPTKEGYNFAGWFRDEDYTIAYDFNNPVTEDLTLYAKFEELTPAYGDANVDGSINALDLVRIKKFIAGALTPTAQQQLNADVNDDGEVNEKDLTLLKAYLGGEIPEANLPSEPIEAQLYLVTYMVDDFEEELEWVIEGEAARNYRPASSDFVGWYTDSDLTNEYEYTPITQDTVLYAKFE